MENRYKRILVPVFKGDEKSFPLWRKRIEQHFKTERLLHTLEKTPEEEDFFQPAVGASNEQEAERKTKLEKRLTEDDSAVNEIWMAIDDEPMGHVLQCKYAKDVMGKLIQVYQKHGPVAMLGLRAKLYTLKNEKYTSLKQLFGRHQELIREIEGMGEALTAVEKLNTLLVAIPDEYRHILGALSVTRREDLEKMSLQQVQRIFLDSEAGAENPPSESPQVAMVGKKAKTMTCFHCGKVGHKKRNCRLLKRAKAQAKKEPVKEHKDVALLTRDNGFVVRIPLARLSSNLIQEAKVAKLDTRVLPVQGPTFFPTILDSGATQHMFRDSRAFNEMWDCPQHKQLEIQLAQEGVVLRARKKGNATLETLKHRRVQIYDVLFIPELSANLLSVSRIESTGKSVVFKQNGVEILDQNGCLLISGRRINGLYVLDLYLDQARQKVFTSKVSDEEMIWHMRFGHIGKQNLSKLVNDNMIERLNIEPSTIRSEGFSCDSCIYGKQIREPFDKSFKVRSSRALELVHSDVCGPLPESTHDGFKYFVTFTDDYTHFVVVYLIRHKSDVFEKFKEYEAMVTAHFSLRISKFRSDNGGEYFGKEFLAFCRGKGIQMIPTAPYTPQQNGVSERMNRTLMEKVRTIMHESNAPRHLWGEALYASMFTLNRSPTNALKNSKTPYEMWYGFKPDASKLKIFGCVAYAHIPKEHCSKLDKRSMNLAMVGYAPSGYRLWNEKTNKVIISRDVRFDEAHFYFMRNIQVDTNSSKPDAEFREIDARDQSENEVESEAETEEEEFLGFESDDGDVAPLEQRHEHVSSENPNGDVAPEEQRHSQRATRAPRWLQDYDTTYLTSILQDDIPQRVDELQKRVDWHKWKQAIDEELQALKENNTWTLVSELPKGRKAINSMWVFSIKDEEESIRYKARLVAKGCSQRPGLDYTETFAPVAKMSTIRVMLSIAVSNNLIIHQMDVKTAFLNGKLEEEIFMKLPKDENGNMNVCRLNKSIYGLKQAGRSWNQYFNKIILKFDFKRLNSDSCMYICSKRDLIIILYVDDILIFGSLLEHIKWVKEIFSRHFKMKDLGEVRNFLGLTITRDIKRGILEISQQPYIEKILDRFGMKDCKRVSTPMDPNCKWLKADKTTTEPYKELLGCLQYLTLMSRPDICVSVNILSQFQSNPGDEHWVGLKRILRYLQGTKTDRLCFTRKDCEPLTGYADADFANDVEERKSISGNMFSIYGNMVSWSSKRQPIVTLSSTEAELVSLCNASKEGIWMSSILSEIGIPFVPFTIYEDNIPCIRISEEPREHQRTKHIDVRYMYIRDLIKEKKVKLKYIKSEDQLADFFTKPLQTTRFNNLKKMIGMIN